MNPNFGDVAFARAVVVPRAYDTLGLADALRGLHERGIDSTFIGLSKHNIERVIFNNPATIVFWGDGTKTVVKCSDDDKFIPEVGLAMAICKKVFGNTGAYNEVFKQWIPGYKVDHMVMMRKNLANYCHKHGLCDGCRLHGRVCRCGFGVSFLSATNGEFDMSDTEIRDAYRKVFGLER